jgi:hypothetical protein
VQGQGSAGEQDDVEREQGDEGVQAVSGVERGDQRENECASPIVPQRLTSQVTEE